MEAIISAADQGVWAGKSVLDATMPQRPDMIILRNPVAAVGVAGISDLPLERLVTIVNRGPFDVTLKANDTAAPPPFRFSAEKIIPAGKKTTVFATGPGIAPVASVKAKLPLKTGLVSYWKMDEASGSTLDAHGPNHLTNNVGVGAAAGKVGGARSMDATVGQGFSIAAGSALFSPGDTDFSIALWVKPVATNVSFAIVSKGYNSGSLSYEMYNHLANLLAWRLSTNGTAVVNAGAGNLIAGQWNFVVAYHNAATDKAGVSINGGVLSATTISGGVFTNSVDFRIGLGGGAGANSLNGQIDEVGYWARVLTPAEIAYLYNGGAGRAYEDL